SFGPRLLSTLRRMLRRQEDAEDALQEAFLAAFRNLDGFEGQSKLSTWLHRIPVNAPLVRLRSQRRRPEASLEDLLPRFEDDGHRVLEPAAPEVSPEERLDAEARRLAARPPLHFLPRPRPPPPPAARSRGARHRGARPRARHLRRRRQDAPAPRAPGAPHAARARWAVRRRRCRCGDRAPARGQLARALPRVLSRGR